MAAIHGTTPKRKHEETKDDLEVVGKDDGKPEKKLALASLGEITLTPISKTVDDNSV